MTGFRDKVKVSGTQYFPSSLAQVEFRCGLTSVLLEPAGQQPQYFGTLGSTLSLQARMPPFMLRRRVKRCCFRRLIAFALRMPLLQCATIS